MLDGRSSTSLKHYAQAAIGPAFWSPAVELTAAVRTGLPQAKQTLGTDVLGWMTAHPAEAMQMSAAMSNLSAPIIAEAAEQIDTRGVGTVVDVGGAEGAFVAALLATNDMLFASGGQEREVDHFRALAGAAGLNITGTTALTSPYQLIEARPA